MREKLCNIVFLIKDNDCIHELKTQEPQKIKLVKLPEWIKEG